jgi:cyclase
MGNGLHKTVRFKNPKYIGDPVNTVKIFNEKGADEIILLDILASKDRRQPDFKKIAEIAGEAFMPMAYGGGVKTFDDAKRVFDAGYEKVIINSAALEKMSLVGEIAKVYGSQSAVVSIDSKKDWLGKYKTYTYNATKSTGRSPDEYAKELESAGAGELMVNAIERDGTWEGYDLTLTKMVSEAVSVPVIACGGASGMDDFRKAVTEGGASAVAAGSCFIYQKKGMGVLISFPAESLKV